MRKLSLLLVLLAVVGAVWLVRGRSSDERVLRRLMDEVQVAALAAMNRRGPDALDGYFATAAEGAQAVGLDAVQQAYKTFVSQQLPSGSIVQFHSFDIDEVEIHKDDGLARVTYRLHFSVVRGNTAIFSAKVTQNLALLRTPRGWRISGGDITKLEEVVGTWPPR